MAGDYDETVSGATAAGPQVLFTETWMPPTCQREDIDAAKEVRKRCHCAAGSSGQLLIRR